MMRIRLAPRLVPTLAAIAMIGLMIWLGRWQTDRAEEKAARQTMFEARNRETPVQLTGSSGPADSLLYRRVRATGQWIPESQVYIDNQIHAGRAGFHVITPLRIRGSAKVVLVNRGWTPRTSEYPAAPAVPVPTGEMEVTGLATLPPRRVLELSSETISNNVWQNLSLARYAERTRLDVLPVVILSDRPAPNLVAVHEQPDAGVAKHREYALTWFSLAATLAVIWIALSVRRSVP
jgi:surfeit locus 1 family protein